MRAPMLLASSLIALLACPPHATAQTSASAVQAAADTPPPAPPGPLTDAIVPSAYRLDLTIDPANPRFSGHVEIDAALNAPSRFLYIHARDLAMRKAVASVAGQTYTARFAQVDASGVALLTFDAPLPAGPITLTFDYDAPFGEGPAGLFRVKVGDDWYVWSQFESTDARAAYPGIDQPGMKQPFHVTLRTPTGLMAVSNAPETSVAREGGMDVHHFAATAPLPTYLLAMMVGPFVHADGAVPPSPQRPAPLPLRIVTTKQNAALMAFPLANAPRIVTLLEDYFNQPFPYPKLDLITTPIMPGAMENAGADLFADNLLVMDANASTAQKRGFGMVVAHELAHQWFGDLVTPAWWDDIWLNESFANWMGFRIGGEWRPDLNIGSGALAEGFAAMGTDALVAGRAIHQPVPTTSQIDAAFDTITYGKGGHVVAMIAGFMGDDKFRDGVRRYMAAHRYGNATSGDFFKAMAEVAGDARILPAMQGFTDQQGVPLLTFTGADGHYTVSQSRYARLGTDAPATRWTVPMCLRRGDVRQCSLVEATGAQVTIAGGGPLVPNAGGTGYYRFELPAADWAALIAQADHLSAGEVQALADSLRASFMAGRAPARLLAHLARVGAANPDSYASNAALSAYASLNDMGVLTAGGTAALNRQLAAITAPMLDKYGFDPRAGASAKEDPETSQRRLQLVARLLGTGQARGLKQALVQATNAWMAGDAAALDPQWYGLGLDAWLGNGGMAAARRLLDKALASQDPLFRPAALDVLSESGNTGIARWLLGVEDQRLRTSERLRMLSGIAATRGTRDFGYGYIRAHIDQLLSGGGGIFFGARLPQVFTRFCSVAKADTIARDFGPKLAGRTSELELARTVERIRDCGRLKDGRGAAASADIAALK